MDTGHERLWVGIDVGKGHHWAVALNDAGEAVFSRKVPNDETEILQLIATACDAAEHVQWAVDLRGKTATLLLVLLTAHGQQVTYVPGRSVNRAAEGYRGEGKTDAKDALIIADMARVRRDFTVITIPPEQVCTLRLLTANRRDLIADRVRLINRMRDLLCGISPALEGAFDYARSKGAVIMLTHYQTPAALRRTGVKRLTTWLQRRKVRSPQNIAEKAVAAANQQYTALPGETRAAALLGELTHQLITLDERIASNDREIRETFRADDRSEIIESLPGMGPILGAEFVAIAGDLSSYRDAGRLAAHAGLAPVPRDSGRRTGNLHRPKRYDRRLRWVFYLSAQSAMQHPGPSRDFYLRKRAEGLRHVQAILALARRRVDVLWAMLRDHRPYVPTPPPAPAGS
ncbi:IS110 family transposase [Streptomyces sp. WAC 06783]|uniref:IS110 family transposase n=1 Tax=Streptomyces sp. WAC 06783 TaxID=2203211 RepID=UPI000F739F1D|nr:IS110 family transposase [Streptomyces sp. WAC 06783]RSO09252.1 IS110 family transposase [Streptomyces sp. WAC 06783]